MIEAIIDIYLQQPYAKSLEILFQLAKVRKFRILKSGTFNEVATCAMSPEIFKTFYHSFPRRGEYGCPSGAESFISNVIVNKVVGR